MDEKMKLNIGCKVAGVDNLVSTSNILDEKIKKNEGQISDIQDNLNTLNNIIATKENVKESQKIITETCFCIEHTIIENINNINEEIINKIENSHNKIAKTFIKIIICLLLMQIFMFSYIISLI